MRLAALFTGGKDSTYAIYLARQQGHEIVCLLTIKSKNLDSYMFHTPAIDLVKLQAQALGLPLVFEETAGEKEKELADLEKAIKKAKKEHSFEGLLTGALFSEYQSSRLKKLAQKLDLKVVSPLWHKSQAEEMEELLDLGFKFILTAVAAEGLTADWLGKIITKDDFAKLKELNKKLGFHLAGEGGEFESLVLDCPLFKKKLIVKQTEVLEENKNAARLIIKKAVLVKK